MSNPDHALSYEMSKTAPANPLAGFELTVKAGTLFVSPGSRLTPAQKEYIAAHKIELLKRAQIKPRKLAFDSGNGLVITKMAAMVDVENRRLWDFDDALDAALLEHDLGAAVEHLLAMLAAVDSIFPRTTKTGVQHGPGSFWGWLKFDRTIGWMPVVRGAASTEDCWERLHKFAACASNSETVVLPETEKP
jgi:hypothetical protein